MTPDQIAQNIVEGAATRGMTLCAAESCTGGMLAAMITGIAGASQVFDRGFVTYSNAAKIQMLGVQPKTLDAFGAVSEQTAAEMAHGAAQSAHADVAVAITGIAGPGGSDHKPEGRVCFGLCLRGKIHTQTIEFGAIGRSNVRQAATSHALEMLLDAIAGV